MTSGARQPGKVVPWTCFEEWKFVMDCLFSEDCEKVKKGYRMVRLWAFRGRIPTSVEATGNLAMLRLELTSRLGSFFASSEDESPVYDAESDGLIDSPHTLRLATTMAIVRFVNEMVDPAQKSSYAQPITRLAEQIGLPRTLVDLRHSGTHDELPSMGVLQLAVDQSLAWLKTNYWEPGLLWRETLRIKCLEMFKTLSLDFEEFEAKVSKEDSTTPEAQHSRRVKLVAKSLNAIEHLQVSRCIQEQFCYALIDYYSLGSRELCKCILECLSGWTLGKFEMVLCEIASERKSFLVSDLIKETFPALSKPPTVSPLIKPSTTEAILEETDALLKRLEERKRQKQMESTQPGVDWRVAKDWVPCDLGSPINFLDFV